MAKPTIPEFLALNPFKRLDAAAGRTRVCTSEEMTQLMARFHRIDLAKNNTPVARAKVRRLIRRLVGCMPAADRASFFTAVATG